MLTIKITENQQLKQEILAALKDNNNYCPCKLERKPENKCMCKEFIEQPNGPCGCGLYYKTED